MKNKKEIKSLICQAVGWSEYQYNEYQYETGTQYLAIRMPLESRARAVAYTRIFWIWWMRMWELTDRKFIEQLHLDQYLVDRLGQELKYDILVEYKTEHDPAHTQAQISRTLKRLIENEHSGKLIVRVNSSN